MAFTNIVNSTTADATEVMGNYYFIGAGDRPPYFQTTAGGLSEIDNTYDLGKDTAGWRRAYIHTIGDSSYSYAFNGQTITSQIGNLVYSATSININSSCSLDIGCTATISEIHNENGIQHEIGPTIKTRVFSIGAWNMDATGTVTYDLTTFYTSTVHIVHCDAFIQPNADILNKTASQTSSLGLGFLNGFYGYVVIRIEADAQMPTAPGVKLFRFGSTGFDNPDFNSDTDNRGYITIKYYED